MDETVQSGVHLVESASKGVEELMYSEESYLQAAGWRSEKASREYRKAIGLLIWTNESTFFNVCIQY